jgi:hypothetical protein
MADHPLLMGYLREHAGDRLLVIGSYAGDAVNMPAAVIPPGTWELLLCNVPEMTDLSVPSVLPPFFAGIWIQRSDETSWSMPDQASTP